MARTSTGLEVILVFIGIFGITMMSTFGFGLFFTLYKGIITDLNFTDSETNLILNRISWAHYFAMAILIAGLLLWVLFRFLRREEFEWRG